MHTYSYIIYTMQKKFFFTAASSLEGKDKKRDEEEYLKSLGAKAPKPVKMPYPMYMSMVKKQRKADQKKQDMVSIIILYSVFFICVVQLYKPCIINIRWLLRKLMGIKRKVKEDETGPKQLGRKYSIE